MSERKDLEYKLVLPDNKYDSKKEFLADLSSLANTAGGHLVFGISEDNGLPVGLTGVRSDDLDSEILRLENLIRDGIQPRIQGISTRSISVKSGDPALIIRVPQSWSRPHAVNYQGHWRFYARNSAGKYPLDVMELKSAFLATTALAERIRNFHFDRLSKIASGETPVSLEGNARLILHFVPYSSFESGLTFSFLPIQRDIFSIPLIHTSVSNYRYNLDGLLVQNERGNNLSGGYTQIFRNGIVESVNASIFGSQGDDPLIPSTLFEMEMISAFDAFVALYQKLSVSFPAVLIVGFTGVKGYELAVNRSLDMWHQHNHKIDRDILVFPEVILENGSRDASGTLQPIFDALWNSAGWAKSYGYDEAGEWGKGPNFRR